MKVPGVLWSAVALFLVSPAARATPDDAHHVHQPANDTQTQPKPEALIGRQHWPRQPIRIPLITAPCRDPPLPHTLYTHALDSIQRGKSASRGSLESGDARRRENWEDGDLEDPLPGIRSVHSMTAEESWTLLGYPYSRPTRVSSEPAAQAPKDVAAQSTQQAQAGYNSSKLFDQCAHIHPLPSLPHAPTPLLVHVFPPAHGLLFVHTSTLVFLSTYAPCLAHALLFRTPDPRPHLIRLLLLPPTPSASITWQALLISTQFLRTSWLAATPPLLPLPPPPPHLPLPTRQELIQVWAPPFEPWQPPPSATTSTTNRPSLTATSDVDDKDPWGPFGDANWFNNWGHGWDHNWDHGWEQNGPLTGAPKDIRDLKTQGSIFLPDGFPSTKDTNTQDTFENSEETLLEALLKNHRLSDETTLLPRHNPQQTTPTLLQHYYNGASGGGPRATTTQQTLSELPLTVSRYSEIPLTQPKPHKNRGSFTVKYKHRHPPRPLREAQEEAQGTSKPLPPPAWERPQGGRIPPVRIHRKTHKAELAEWTPVPWRPNFADMVPVATRRRKRCALCHQ